MPTPDVDAAAGGSDPVLADGVVRLRRAEPGDLQAIERGIHDPDVLRWIGPPEGSAADVLELNRRRWEDGSPTLAICGSDDVCVGLVWLNRFDREADRVTVGYWLLADARGRGLATRAVRLVVAWAFEAWSITRVGLNAATANAASRAVAERAGFRLIESSAENVRYERLRPEGDRARPRDPPGGS